jgi:predicted DNA repair protein MutK
VTTSPFITQISVMTAIAVLMTIGVYGLVAGIVKLDDLGLYLSKASGDDAGSRLQRNIGAWILTLAPYLMKTLSIAGTAAMFLVGGGILVHGIPGLEPWIHDMAAAAAAALSGLGGLLAALMPMLANAILGIVAGAVAVAVMTLIRRISGSATPAH